MDQGDLQTVATWAGKSWFGTSLLELIMLAITP